jgi:hypothetical protein
MGFISQTGNMTRSQSLSAETQRARQPFCLISMGRRSIVYKHVLAWHKALLKVGIALSVWRIHRCIGISGGLLVNALSRETDYRLRRRKQPDKAGPLEE